MLTVFFQMGASIRAHGVGTHTQSSRGRAGSILCFPPLPPLCLRSSFFFILLQRIFDFILARVRIRFSFILFFFQLKTSWPGMPNLYVPCVCVFSRALWVTFDIYRNRSTPSLFLSFFNGNIPIC